MPGAAGHSSPYAPPSGTPVLPYGGIHRGAAGYVALIQRTGRRFELQFDLDRLESVGNDTVLLRMVVTFTAHATGRSASLPVVE